MRVHRVGRSKSGLVWLEDSQGQAECIIQVTDKHHIEIRTCPVGESESRIYLTTKMACRYAQWILYLCQRAEAEKRQKELERRVVTEDS